MSRLALSIPGIALFVAAISAQPHAQQPETRIESGRLTRIGLINRLDQNTCKPVEGEAIRVAQLPEGGSVEIRGEPVSLTQGRCVSVPLLGHAIYFLPNAGFKGRVRIAVEIGKPERAAFDLFQFPLLVE